MPRTLPPFQTVTTGFVVAVVGFFSSFPILLQGIRAMGADDAQAASGLMFAALAMGLAGLVLSFVSRIPASVAWSTPGAALLASTVVPEGGFAVAVGAFLFAGVLTLVAGLYRPLGRLTTSIPAPLAQAMLAGVLLGLCLAPFRALAEVPLTALPILVTWFVVSRCNRTFAVPAAVLVAFALTVIEQGYTVPLPDSLLTVPQFVMPQFELSALLSIGVPLFIVTMAAQNIPGIAVLRSFGYDPSAPRLLSGTAIASILSAPFGAPQTCVAAITAAMCSDADSHPDPAQRWWSAVMAGLFYCLFGLFAAAITTLAAAAPHLAVETLAGVALLGVFAHSAGGALEKPETREAAAVTFLVTASGITIIGLSAAVWGLLLGGLVHVATRLKRR
ncbi:benzoate/H(+) symporter BenE family transporter [Psychromarinibacter halotolerans]|uniref:Benzoate/H(+) symporter BenE family transporter n=1 Tax=Psychromarinibacter halotolerans TaxID=1775175 RepID=A0ABV7GIX0_9RHOB|nr:benzoate/H(+) symporter BenE family transporter [Psychromarinibacter halotolerans]MDF0596034.1 benzoate/H(+) symporter BenE family transporter [Psychromarinibacter halotolerans]